MKLTRIRTYLNTPSKCYIPKCKSRCCANAPLPEDFLPKHQDKVQRKIFNIINIGQNDPKDTYNSVMFNTTGNPIQIIGVDQYGNKLFGIPQNIMEELQIKNMEQIQELLEHHQKFPHYCPFIKNNGRCNVYAERPPICREFGTDPSPINICPDKATPLEVFKDKLKNFLDVKGSFKFLFNEIKAKFSKS